MKNIIRIVLFAFFYLISQEGMGMELNLEIGPKKSIQEELKLRSAEVQYGAIDNETYYRCEPLKDFILTEEKYRLNVLMTILGGIIGTFNEDLCQTIWGYFDNHDKLKLCLLSKKFYSAGQSTYLNFYELKLKEILIPRDYISKKNFSDLFIYTKKLDFLSNYADFPEIQDKSKHLVMGHQKKSCIFLDNFKDGIGNLSKSEYEDQYIYLCNFYGNNYVPSSYCEQLESSCGKCCSITKYVLCCNCVGRKTLYYCFCCLKVSTFIIGGILWMTLKE